MVTTRTFWLFVSVILLSQVLVGCGAPNNTSAPIQPTLVAQQPVIPAAITAIPSEPAATVLPPSSTAPANAEQSALLPPVIPVVHQTRVAKQNWANEYAYNTDVPYEQVVAFYKEQMIANGWTEYGIDLPDAVNPGSTEMYYLKNDRHAVVDVLPPVTSRPTISYVTINPLGWNIGHCPLVPGDANDRLPDIPMFDRDLISWCSSDLVLENDKLPKFTLRYQTLSDVDSMLSFYKTAMADSGWNLVTEKGGGYTVPMGTLYEYFLTYDKPGRIVKAWMDQLTAMEKVELEITTYVWKNSTVHGTRVRLTNRPKE